MKLRSLLFVPGDRPERFPKAVASGADALILDLEDSVAPDNKAAARRAVAAWLAGDRGVPCFVRLNALDQDIDRDLAAVLPAAPNGLMLPKADDAGAVEALLERMHPAVVPILPIACESPAGIFSLSTFTGVARYLAGLTWGAEDLSAAVGAAAARGEDGAFTGPFDMVRALTLFAAGAAAVPAIETVYPAIADLAGLAACVARARRDGFTGMMAIHPSQIAIINAGFSPGPAEIAHARKVIDAFGADPGLGAVQIDGRMIDHPHLLLARRMLAQAE